MKQRQRNSFAEWESFVVEGLVCPSLLTSITRRAAITLVNLLAARFTVVAPMVGRSWPFNTRVGGFYDHKGNTIYAHPHVRLTLAYLHEFTHTLLRRRDSAYTGAHNEQFVGAYIDVISVVLPQTKPQLLHSARCWALLKDGTVGDQESTPGNAVTAE